MNALIDFQTIVDSSGAPAFVVVPYAEFIKHFPGNDGLIPHDVVGRNLVDGVPMVRAWREHLGLTQDEVAQRAGITQAALSQIESGKHKAQKATRQKLAAAMGLTLAQLV